MPRRIDDLIDAEPALADALTPDELHFLRIDGRGLEGDTETLLYALADIRAGRWDRRDTTDFGDHTVPGAGQRQLMQRALLAADELFPRVEALRAWALHGLHKHHGASHSEIADMLGVARATASSRWRALERKRPEMWDWARGSDEEDDWCDGLSVGVILETDDGRVLVIERAAAPWGMACPSGHGTGHGRPGMDELELHRAIGSAELREETGLRVEDRDLELLSDDWRDNRCRRRLRDGDRPGHRWIVFRARRWTGTLTLAPDEVRSAHWRSPTHLQELVERTVELAHGRITAEEFRARPGAEPTWVRRWRDAGYVRISAADLEAVEALAAAPPATV